jgi:hypothetical protein
MNFVFCPRTDLILTGVGNCLKEVDDILTQGSTWARMMSNPRKALQSARENDATISEDKLEFGTRVKYTGVIIERGNAITDPEKSAAIQDFPTSQNATDVR